ncbi:MAG TPA: GspE/PulE family protein [Gemmataceae bacterium]|jgi:type II secretory ATPase GspE/PulE/Tfp pilus assembly ATPase PilB-like protein
MGAAVQEFSSPQLDVHTPEQAIAALLEQASRFHASDLFLASSQDRVDVSVRHLGIMRPLARLPLELGHRCISHVKVMANMDVAERRRPQDGRWIYRGVGSPIDLRVSTLPTLHGEDCALRLFLRGLPTLTLEDLGFIRSQMNDLLAMLNSPSGLVLVTGPTGSGKTTTLYACLRYLHDGERKIHTIEDPVEHEIAGVRQSQVNPRIGLGFPELLRGVLRQDPDVILIGEIRDASTAETAVHAANSGHLVLATLYAPVAAGAVQSMRGWGVNPHFLGHSLLGVIAQRLVRTLCPHCRAPFPLPEDAPHPFAEVTAWLGSDEGHTLFAAKGCALCHQAGYGGRTGVFETLRISPMLHRMIAEGQQTTVLREQARREGMIEMRQAALLKVARGETTAEEVVRDVPSEYLGLEG